MHRVFGASKAAADLMVQEYGRYFGMKTACFRGGCLTGPDHSGAQLHGFLAYLMRCVGDGPAVHGVWLQGQSRCATTSTAPTRGRRAIISSGRRGPAARSTTSAAGASATAPMLEAIALVRRDRRQAPTWQYTDANRVGDHIWWISDTGRFSQHFPTWVQQYDLRATLEQMLERQVQRQI